MIKPIPKRPNLLARENPPPPPKQTRSIERRQRLNAAALRLFGTQGYEAASIEAIASDASIPVGGFYQHYRSKRQLLLSLMNDLLVGLSGVSLDSARGMTPRTMIRELLERGFERDLQYLGAYRAWKEAVLTDADMARKHRWIHTWTSARIATVFRRLQQLPGARSDVDVEGLAQILDFVFWDLLERAARRRDADLRRSVDATVHLIYHSLFADGLQTSRSMSVRDTP